MKRVAHTHARSDDCPAPPELTRQAFWQNALQPLLPRIRGYVATLGCTLDDMEELVSDVVSELAAHEQSFMNCVDEWEFVLPIVRDTCSQAVRRWRHELLDATEVVASADGISWEVREQYYLLLSAWSHSALGLLSPKERVAVALHVMQGQPYREVAAALHTSEGAVRRNVWAGLKRLRQQAPPPPAKP